MNPISSNLPGVTIERRTLLCAPALFAAGAQGAPQKQAEESALAFDEFTKRCEALAGEHLEGGRIDGDVYLHRLEALGKRLAPSKVPRPEMGDFGGYDPPIELAPVHRATQILVLLWRLAPGAFFPPHNHTPGYVMSLCLEGECWLRHFETVGDAPTPGDEGSFEMRKTLAKLLRPGMATTLTPDRDNIHTFQAGPEGAFGLDVNTSLPGGGEWSMLSYEEGKREGFTKLYDAKWIGKP